MKYVMFEVEPIGGSASGLRRFEPVIFGSQLVHAEVAKAMVTSMGRRHGWRARPISAGTVEFSMGSATCSGESETLSLKSRGDEDDAIIDMIDYGGNFL